MYTKFVVSYTDHDGIRRNATLAELDDARTFGLSVAKDGTFDIYIERDKISHYLSWDLIIPEQTLYQKYENRQKLDRKDW